MSLTPNAATTPLMTANATSAAMSAASAARQRDSVSGDSSLLISPHKSNLQHHQHHHHHNNQPPQNVISNVTNDHHPILRVASAHGSRDCVNLLPYHAAIGQHKMQQRAQFQNVSSSNALSSGTVQMARSNANVVDTPGPSSIQMQQPPLYQQAVQDVTKFGPPYRRSPESRAIQAVQPFGLVGAGGGNVASDALPTIIPKECQVVKQLVREVVASQLANQGSLPSGNVVPNSNQPQFFAPQGAGITLENSVAAGTADPPPYSAIQQRSMTQQERRQPVAETSERSTSLHQNYVHDPMPTSPKSALIDDPSVIMSQRQQQQPALAAASSPRNAQQMQQLINVNNNMGSLRMSLSHSDLSRLQHLTLAPEVQPQISKMHPLLAAQQQNPRPPNMDSIRANASNMAALALLSHQQASFLPQLSSPTPGLSTVASTSRQSDSSMTDSSAYLHYLNLQRSYQRQILEGSSVTATSPPNLGNLTPHFDLLENSRRDATSVITTLAEENKKLRTDLEGSFKKALKLQQLELQYQKISRDYDDLVKKQEKRDQLEQQMHRKMQVELNNLTEMNNNLNDQLELCYSQMDQYQADNLELRQELERLVAQNKELFAIKERQEIELEAQRDTLEEQRAHIVILDKALSNAQEKVLKLDEECKRRNSLTQRCEQLQQEVNTLREAVQKRDDLYKRNTAQLQKEIAQLRVLKKENKKSISNDLEDISIAKLKRELQEKENQMYNFQQESERWQKLYNDEIQRKETTMEELSEAKNARIKSLEETNVKTEKKMEELENKLQVAEARYNILKRQSQAVTNANLLFTSHETPYDGKSSKAIYSGVPDLMDGSKKRLEAVHRILQNPPPSSTSVYRFANTSSGSSAAGGLYQRHHNKFTSVDSSFAAGSPISSSTFSKKGEYKHEYGSLGRHSSSALTSSGGGNRSSAAALFKQRLATGGATSSGGGPLFAVSSINAATASPDLIVIRHPRTQSSCETLSSIYSPSATVAKRLTATAPLAHREFLTSPTRRSQSKTPFLKEGKLNRPRSADDHLFSREGSEERDAAAVQTSAGVKDGNKTCLEIAEKSESKRDEMKFFGKAKIKDEAEDDDNFDFVSSTIRKGDLTKLNKIAAKLTRKAADSSEEELFDV